MFAKLKEKIQKESGNVSEGERSFTGLPGHASPRRISLSSSPSQSPVTKEKPATEEITGVLGDNQAKLEFGSKEEMLLALQKKTEACKKLEEKVNEYASVIKDNNNKIEKLETFIEKQQDAVAKKSQELNEQHQASRLKLSETHMEELAKRDKEKQELLNKLKETENIRERFYKKEEEKEEIKGFATQELAKVKHMLILKEEELSKSLKEVKSKTDLLEEEQKRTKELTNELKTLQGKLKTVEEESSRLEEETVGHGKIVSALTKERMALEESLTQVKTQLSEKSSMLSTLQSKHTELENAQQTLVRNSDLQKNKTSQLLQEKEEHIEQLQERVRMLEQREQDQALSGDERFVALEKERDGLEKKLAETREQLSQIKSGWSEKISHLEQQIAHLNGKMAEDSEELMQAQKLTETVRSNMHKEIEQLKEKLAAAEKHTLSVQEEADTKAAHFKKEKLELETEISRMKLDRVDQDTNLRSKIASLEAQITTLETAKAHEKAVLEDQLEKCQRQEKEYLEKQIRTEKQVEEEERKHADLLNQLRELESTCESLRRQVTEKEGQLADLSTQIKTLREEQRVTQERLEKYQEKSKASASELVSSNKDKDELMIRNVELSQQLTTLQKKSQDEREALEKEKLSLEEELQVKTESEAQLQEQCQQLQSMVTELTETQTNHLSNAETVGKLEDTVASLEEQLADRNKAFKKQEQRLNDLKKTLQRELKVQSLPNDETVDPKLTSLTPPLPRKNVTSRTQHSVDHGARTKRQTSHDLSPFPNESVQETVDLGQVSNASEDFFVGQGAQKYSHGVSNSHATISVNDRLSAFNSNSYGSSQSHLSRNQEFDTRHLEKDINFQYLKHVVMKFMLSREHEAIQLIKAVSLLLRFTPEEQKLIKDTLQWKMSWFGGSQPPAVVKGLSSKIIPPSY